MFELSHISKRLPAICGNTFHILGDSAYPIREDLLVPFKDFGRLTPEQRNFNYCHACSRVTGEHSIGILKQRFKQLFHMLDFHSVDKMSRFTIACCVLHNLCVLREDVACFDDDEGDEGDEPDMDGADQQ